MQINTEKAAAYSPSLAGEAGADEIITQALNILRRRLGAPGAALNDPDATRAYLQLEMAALEREVFACIFLNNRNRVIAFEKLFYGTVDGAAVYPREVVKAVLEHNAAAVIFAHNHPSGDAEPSAADNEITRRLREALALIDVRVLDHLIVGRGITSLAERGLV
jgi:DNA repair protein RadC